MNPWEEINLDDYEKHMSLDSVKQLQAMNEIGYRSIKADEYLLPNGKKLILLDYKS